MHTLLTECNNCDNLQSALDKLDCSILYMTKRKYAIISFNLLESFDEERFQDLVRYRRIVSKRMYGNVVSLISNADVIAKVSQLAFKDNCSECENCK